MDKKYTKELNYLFATEDVHGRTVVIATGNVTAGFPFLYNGKNRVTTPFYLETKNDAGEKVQGAITNGSHVVVNGSNFLDVEVPKVAAELRNLRLPTVAVNISSERYEKALKYAPALKELSHTKKPSGGITLFLPFLAFDADAVFLHQHVMQGDTVTISGTLEGTTVGNLRENQQMVWCNDIRKIREAKRNLPVGRKVDA